MNFLQDDKGNNSSMRLMCLISLCAAIVFGFIALTHSSTNQNDIQITALFLIAAFAPKTLQKHIELKNGI